MKKHENKRIQSNVKQLQRWVESYTYHEQSYRQMGFDEAARRSRVASTALLIARETQYGMPTERALLELNALLEG